MTQKDIFGNETKFFEKASFFNGAEFTGNVVIDGSLVQPSVWSVNEGNVYYTNGSMSVGTGSPNFSSFGSNTSGIEISDVNTNNALKVQSGSNDFYFANTPTNNYIWGVNDVPLTFGTNHVARLHIQSDGKLGLGEIAPDFKFHSKETGGSSIAGLFETNQTDAYISFQASGTTTSSTVRIGAVGDNFQAFINGSERLRITSAGNIGIGTDNPTAKLDVDGDVTATGQITAPNIQVAGDVNVVAAGSSVTVAAGSSVYINSGECVVNSSSVDAYGQLHVQQRTDLRPPFSIFFHDNSIYKNLGSVGPNDRDGLNATGRQYLHVRLRTVWNDASMTMFRITGYYSYSDYTESYVGMYRYNNASYRTNPYGQVVHNQKRATIHSIYNEAADPGYLVIVCDWGTNYMGLMFEHIGAGSAYASYMQPDIEIIDSLRSNATTALVF